MSDCKVFSISALALSKYASYLLPVKDSSYVATHFACSKNPALSTSVSTELK